MTSLVFAEAARRVGALRVNLLRLPVAAFLLSLVLAFRASPFAGLDGPRLSYLAASGVVGLVAGDLAFFEALRRLGPRLSALVMASAPIFAFLAGVPLLGEVPSPRAGFGAVLTLAGIAWVVSERRSETPASERSPAGVGFGVLGAVCQGVGLALAKLGMAEAVDPLAATWIRISVATAGIWLLAACGGRLVGIGLVPGLRSAGRFVLAGAFFGPFLGVWLSLVAVRHTAVGVAATIMATTPVLLIPLVAVTEHYRPSVRALLGTVAAVVGVALLFAR